MDVLKFKIKKFLGNNPLNENALSGFLNRVDASVILTPTQGLIMPAKALANGFFSNMFKQS